MKRITKQKKGFKRIGRVNVKAAGIVMAALMGAGSVIGAVGAVNVFAEEESTVETVSQEESVNAAESLTGTEETGNAVNAESDASGAEAKETTKDITVDTEEKTDESSVQNENTTPSYTTIVENNKDIRLENITEDKKSSGVGAVNAVEAVKNGWVKASGGYKYYKNGKAYTGWHKMGKAEGEKTAHWSYFGKNGVIYTGWKKMGKAEGEKTAHWSYFGSNGWLRTGWVQLGKGTSEPDGNTAKHWSYFGSNGWLRTGWVQLGKGTSEPDGNVAKHWSFFGDNGWLRTGWQNMGKGTSNPDGNSKKHKSYFGGNGWLRTGVQTINGKKYHFDNKGWLKYSDAAIPPKEQPENVWNGIYNIEVRFNNGAHLYLPSFSTGYFYEGLEPHGNFGWDYFPEGGNKLVYWNFIGDKVYSGQKYFKINTNKLHVGAQEPEIDIAVKTGNSVPSDNRYNTYRKIGKSGGKIYYIEFSMPESWRSVWNYYNSQYYNDYADKIVSSAWVE